jgi:CheY-like chemotaxis protein
VNNIEIVKALAADLPLTVADAQQLQQVFINLIINAEQAMLEAHGQGRLVIQTREKPTASPAPDAPAREIEVVIADDGPGVVPAHFNRIFEPFFTTKPVGQGTGLGLSVSHSIIQEHGGRLSAHNRADGGATFIIELPVVEPAAVPETASPEAPLRDVSHPMRVLIIDDEPAIVGLLERIVLAEGHRVDTAADGAQALAQLEQHSYDVIFCDMKMPFLSGPGLYQELKRRNGTMTQKMIFITGDVIGDDTRTFLEQTGSRCLEKPFVREDVIRVVQSLLVDEVLQD